MGISLDKLQAKAPELVSLAKNANATLQNKGLAGHKAKAALVLDYSGSMRYEYAEKDGKPSNMQQLAERALAFATQIDDDGAIDIFLFETEAHYIGELTLDNFRNGGLQKLIGKRHMGTTNYAGAFDAVRNHFFGTTKKSLFGGSKSTAPANAPFSSPADLPVHATFLTDGSPDNKSAAVRAITEASFSPIFWQFLSIGRESMPFLEKLDDLDNRYIDNADYKPVGDVSALTSSELYNIMLDEYPAWVAEERKRGQIR